MASTAHQAASAHLPAFIAAPGETDVLLVVATVILIGAILMTGVLFFWLHSLPERLAHKSQKLQFEIVAVLGLLSLFTHVHLFWVLALLLAFIEIPDFSTPIRDMAKSLQTMAGRRRRDVGDVQHGPIAPAREQEV